jgi:hypothetical protein
MSMTAADKMNQPLPYALSAQDNGRILLRVADAFLMDSLEREPSIAEIRHIEGVLSWLRAEEKKEKARAQADATPAPRRRWSQENRITAIDRW